MTQELADQSSFQWLARFGFVMRGLLYMVIAALVIATGRTESLTGAIVYLNHGVGRGLTLLLVAGMAGYGLWRVADAAFGMNSGRHHSKAWRKRTAAAFSGAIYLFLAYKGALIMVAGRSDFAGAQQQAADALDLPAGAFAIFASAAVLVGVGGAQFYKAGSCSFLDDLDERAQQLPAKWIGRIGYAARGVVFLTVGWLLARSAFHRDAAQAGGLEEALDALRGPLQFPVAAGLLLFGVYSIVEARYRSIRKPPTEHIKRKVDEAVTG